MLARAVLEHHFSHAAEIVLPWPSSPGLEPSLVETECYWRVCGSLADLLQQPFIDDHVRVGELYALSTASIASACTFAIIPPGKLLIVCTREIYDHLGLEGNPSMFDKSRYCICVNILGRQGTIGHPAHTRVQAALRLIGKVQLVLLWQDPKGENRDVTFPASIQSVRCCLRSSWNEFRGLPLPDLDRIFIDSIGCCSSAGRGMGGQSGMAVEQASVVGRKRRKTSSLSSKRLVNEQEFELMGDVDEEEEETLDRHEGALDETEAVSNGDGVESDLVRPCYSLASLQLACLLANGDKHALSVS